MLPSSASRIWFSPLCVPCCGRAWWRACRFKMAHDFGYEVQAVFFDVPTEVWMERNQRRNRVVPEDVMQRMAGKLRPLKFDEGFSKITVVRVKQASEEEPAQSG